MKNINLILKEILNKITPSREELDSVSEVVRNFMNNLEKELKKNRINAEVFVGGSFAKKTMIKKGVYDTDIFLRFDKEYIGKDISKIAESMIKGAVRKEKISMIHGSRDYFKVEPPNHNFFIEVVPVIKVKKPKDAENITDLSYFHVNYIRKKLKTEKILGEVRLAKAFCHANKCYGAESYINGFSGYAIELLIYHYKNFLNLVKAMAKIKEKEIIDIERLYRNKQELMMNMNSSKMSSPVILIDPTYKERNALAALSKETLENFKEKCKRFLKNPSEKFFETEKIDLEKIEKTAGKNRREFILISAKTDKAEGDVAGSKLMKFFRHLQKEISKSYVIYQNGFDYSGQKEAQYFFVVKSRGKIVLRGPDTNDKKNIASFKRKHKKTFVKNKKIYAEEKIDKNAPKFLKEWIKTNHKKMKDMYINELKLIS